MKTSSEMMSAWMKRTNRSRYAEAKLSELRPLSESAKWQMQHSAYGSGKVNMATEDHPVKQKPQYADFEW